MKFYIGLHQPSDAKFFDSAFLSVNRMRDRKSPIDCKDWIMDSGAFTEIATHGHYRMGVEPYAAEIRRWALPGSGITCAVAQDYMCEAIILEKTGLTVVEHQRLTIERFDALLECDTRGVPIMPVLQGYTAEEYVSHLRQYGDRIGPGAYVGVGSVCKRNTDVDQVTHILISIKRARPDIRIHGFGLKITALSSGVVRDLLFSADSMAWSYAARKQGLSANDRRVAQSFVDRIATMPVQNGWAF